MVNKKNVTVNILDYSQIFSYLKSNKGMFSFLLDKYTLREYMHVNGA